MAKTVYVDGASGDNGNDGLSWATAKGTILGARAVTASGDRVIIAPGVYPETKAFFSSSNDSGVCYMADPTKNGVVIVDFENSSDINPAYGFTYTIASHWRTDKTVKFVNINFRNPYTNTACLVSQGGLEAYHCTFYQRDGSDNTGVGIATYWSASASIIVKNCSFYNLDEAWYRFTGPIRNCYIVDTTTAQYGCSDMNYNAYPGNSEVNGINTSTGANPGFRDADNEDFRIDPGTYPADFATFMNGGEYGERIAAFGKGGIYYNAYVPQLRMLSPDPSSGNPQVAWENEGPNGTNTYTDGTPGDMIEDGSTSELKLDLTNSPTGGRARSDVIYLGDGSITIGPITIGAFEDVANGAAIDTDTSLPQKIEYRSSASSFAKGDASPSWIEVSRGTYLSVTGHSYLQWRVEVRTDHSGT